MSHEKREKFDGKIPDDSVCDCMVSVSCITFNHGRYLRQALDSFLMQETDFRYEILIHDDASTDDTIDIIKEYQEKYPDIIRPVFEEENQYSKGISNISGVFNFPRARGRYIAMCEGDDFWTDKRKLKKQVEIMERDRSLSLCCHGAVIVSEDGAFRSENKIRPFSGGGIIKAEDFIKKKTNIPTASMLFKAEYAQRLPRWYFDCPVGDIPLQLFMVENGGIYYIDELISAYRMGREGSWGEMMDNASDTGKLKAKWEAHYEAMRRLYKAFDSDTCGKWQEASDTALKRLRFHIDLKEGNAKAVLDKKNAEFLKELSKTEAALQRLKARAPLIYELIRNVYLRCRKILH